MRKGIGRYDNAIKATYQIPQPILLPPEVFTMVTDWMVKDVRPYYLISNYGRLYHIYKNEFLTNNVDSKGYLYKPLATADGTPKNVRIHRLVMMAFSPIPGCENMLINHLDGNKCNDAIWNLEWCNYSENQLHAIKTGLMNYDEFLPDETVREVCKLLEDPNITLKSVAEETGASYSQVQSIQGKRTHTDISDEYNIQPRKIVANLTETEVHSLCLWFQDHPKPNKEILNVYCSRALQSIGYYDSSTRLIRTAKKIYTKETYKYISCYYNF